jgi:hypothetical protein
MNQVSQPAANSPVTLINVFEVPTEHVAVFGAQWRERAALMSTKPGFLDTRLHRALSPQTRFQPVNVAHRETREASRAATADTEVQVRINAATTDPRVPVSANAALCRAAAEFCGPAPDEHRTSPSGVDGKGSQQDDGIADGGIRIGAYHAPAPPRRPTLKPRTSRRWWPRPARTERAEG